MLTDLRKFAWLYLILLIFEGALRKWGIPALDAPLLLVRDPVVLWIYYQAAAQQLKFINGFFIANLALAVVATLVSFAFGIGDPVVTIYGFRTDFMQIPLIFLLPQILNRDDVILMGKFILYVSVPTAALVLLQFRSPPDSFWNKGAMATQYGTVRPSGPFSFVTGLASFYSLTTAFLMYGFIRPGTYKIWLMVLVTFATLGASACSGSRLSLVSIAIVAVVAVLCVVTRGKGGGGLLVAGAAIAVALGVLSQTSIFKDGTQQLNQRFSDAGAAEGNATGFVNRFLASLSASDPTVANVPTFGYGLGMGTNVGLNLYQGNADIMWPEAEWSRLVFESGTFLGILLCIFRTALTVALGLSAFAAYRRDNFLPALLYAAGALQVLNGQWGVATSLGFAIFVAGLSLAAAVEPPVWDNEPGEPHHEHDGEHHGLEPDHSQPADHVG